MNCDHGDANKIYNHDVKNSHNTAAKNFQMIQTVPSTGPWLHRLYCGHCVYVDQATFAVMMLKIIVVW